MIWQNALFINLENFEPKTFFPLNCSVEVVTEKFTLVPIPCSRIYPAATCSQARRFERPSVRPSMRLKRGQSSMSSSQNVTCCSWIASDYWSNPSGSSKRVYCSCWDCTDCTDYARSCMIHDSVHMTVGCGRSPVALLVATVLSWWMSWSPKASGCHRSVPIENWCWDIESGGPMWCPSHCLWDYRSQKIRPIPV